jgi:hypothetical protein
MAWRFQAAASLLSSGLTSSRPSALRVTLKRREHSGQSQAISGREIGLGIACGEAASTTSRPSFKLRKRLSHAGFAQLETIY